MSTAESPVTQRKILLLLIYLLKVKLTWGYNQAQCYKMTNEQENERARRKKVVSDAERMSKWKRREKERESLILQRLKINFLIELSAQ